MHEDKRKCAKTHSHWGDVLTLDSRRNQLEPTGQHLLLNTAKNRRANLNIPFMPSSPEELMILSNSVWSSAFSFPPRASKTIGTVFPFVLCLAFHRRSIQYRIERLRHIRFAYVLLKTVQSLASTQKPHNPQQIQQLSSYRVTSEDRTQLLNHANTSSPNNFTNGIVVGQVLAKKIWFTGTMPIRPTSCEQI